MRVISIAKASASVLLYIIEAGGHSMESVCESGREESRSDCNIHQNLADIYKIDSEMDQIWLMVDQIWWTAK